jgi:DNA-binding response OmpR family regulator
VEARPKVLIIEDNADLLSILQQLLSESYDVFVARRGEDGVRIALSVRPDVVILDLQLPQMDGIEAGRWIKRELGAVPILVLTAMTGNGESEAILRSGCCDAYLAKPAPLQLIRATIVGLLGGQPAGRARAGSASRTGGAGEARAASASRTGRAPGDSSARRTGGAPGDGGASRSGGAG